MTLKHLSPVASHYHDYWRNLMAHATGKDSLEILEKYHAQAKDAEARQANASSLEQVESVMGHSEKLMHAMSLIKGSLTNKLSGLPNYEAYRRSVEKLGSNPDIQQVAIGQADLRNFKRFNDRRGDEHGDRAIALHGILLEEVRQRLGLHNVFIFQPSHGDEYRAVAIELKPRSNKEAEEAFEHPEFVDPSLAINKLFGGYAVFKGGFETRLKHAIDASKRGNPRILHELKFVDHDLPSAEFEKDLNYHPLEVIHLAAGISGNEKNIPEAKAQADEMQRVTKLLGRGHASFEQLNSLSHRDKSNLLHLSERAVGRGANEDELSREQALEKLFPKFSDFKRFQAGFPQLRISLPTNLAAYRSKLA